MADLKPCPCGKTPTALAIEEGCSCKYAYASGDCCSEWSVEFRTEYLRLDAKAAMALAIAAWNDAPRSVDALRAEVEALREWKQDLIDTHMRVVADECAPDVLHCTCVPFLRREIAALKAALADTRQGLWRVYEELGFDTGGDPTPASVVNLVQMVVSAAKEFRAEAEGHNALADSTVGGLMEEIAALKADNQQMHHDWMADHAELEHLKEELANRQEPPSGWIVAPARPKSAAREGER